MSKKIVTRVAPSPSGNLHIGTALVSLFSYLYAKQHDGEFILRLDDTDTSRCEERFEKDILDSLEWLGLTYDRVERQSERTELYSKKIQQLLDTDKAYVSKEPAKDNPDKEVEVVRLKNANVKLTFTDTVRGEITFDTTELKDFVIARSVTDPLYHLASVIDDGEMGVTHVIRGEDHISNTPRQILILEALGYERPVYTHIPLILATDRSKLSKRKGAASVTEYRDMGFMKEAILNQLALLGWNPGTEQEVFTLEELEKAFSLEKIHTSGAMFDIEKLKWLQKEHRKKRPLEEVYKELYVGLAKYPEIVAVLQQSKKAREDILERYTLLSEMRVAIEEGEYDFYKTRPKVDKEGLTWKKDKNPDKIASRLMKLQKLLSAIDSSSFTYDAVKDAVLEYAEEEGKGDVLWPLRYALSGKDRSPDPFTLGEALGKEETLERLKQAQKVCQ